MHTVTVNNVNTIAVKRGFHILHSLMSINNRGTVQENTGEILAEHFAWGRAQPGGSECEILRNDPDQNTSTDWPGHPLSRDGSETSSCCEIVAFCHHWDTWCQTGIYISKAAVKYWSLLRFELFATVLNKLKRFKQFQVTFDNYQGYYRNILLADVRLLTKLPTTVITVWASISA